MILGIVVGFLLGFGAASLIVYLVGRRVTDDDLSRWIQEKLDGTQ